MLSIANDTVVCSLLVLIAVSVLYKLSIASRDKEINEIWKEIEYLKGRKW